MGCHAGQGGLPALPAGRNRRHWSSRVQVDVVALNWKTHEILLGECKWGADPVDPQVVRELIERKTPLLLRDLPDQGEGWKVHHALFARSGFTSAALAEMQEAQGLPPGNPGGYGLTLMLY